MFIDAAGVSATFLMTAPIANDLGVKMGDLAWILGTYSYVVPPTPLLSSFILTLIDIHL